MDEVADDATFDRSGLLLRLGMHFDVGNVVIYAFPQDWIRTLGSRIDKIHLKDFNFDRPNGKFTWKPIGEGDIPRGIVSTASRDS